MKRSDWIMLGVGGLILSIVIAWFQRVPGYMDAEYYYAGGMRIASGQCQTEPFIWNYLDDPTGLPHPSFSYWMPMASILAGAGMWITGQLEFFSARIFFFMLSGIIPILTATLTLKLGGNQKQARLAGWFAIFSGFYAIYTGITETFAISMAIGSCLLLVLASNWGLLIRCLVGGALAGLMHLTRADGLLWLGAIGIWVGLEYLRLRPMLDLRTIGKAASIAILAYGIVMSPWFLRNLNEWGSILPPGGSRTLWLTDYNQTYVYPASDLSFSALKASGIGEILLTRLNAAWINLKTIIVIQGGIALLPLIIVGGWQLRRNIIVKTGTGMWLGMFLFMSLVFPFAGSRGGFFHSGAAIQPLIWATAAIGLNKMIEWGRDARNWQLKTAWNFFSTGLVILMAFLTIFIVNNRVVGNEENSIWSEGADRYSAVENWLRQQDEEGSIVMVNNPPGYYVAGKRAAIVIPYGELEIVQEVAKRYGAIFLVLEENTTPQMKEYFDSPRSVPGLKYLEKAGEAQIYRFEITIP